MLRQTARGLGSLQLAVVLLTTLAVVLAAATFYESRTSTAAVTAVVYRSWWFNALLGALALNLIMAAAVRWPWKRRQIGFVVTHAGLVLILGGCSAAFHFGTEGLMGLRVGEPPSDTVQLEERALIAMTPELTQVRLRVSRRGDVRPKAVRLPNGVMLRLEEFYPNAKSETVVTEGAATWQPAVQLRWCGISPKHDTRQWLLVGDTAGGDTELLVARDASELTRLMNAPPSEPRLVVAWGNHRLEVPIQGHLERDLMVPGTDLVVRILNYWPDFRMTENREMVNVSDAPNNPVALVTLTRGASVERIFVFGDPRIRPLVRRQQGEPIGAQLQLLAPAHRSRLWLIAVADSADLYYVAQSAGQFRSGRVVIGQPLNRWWAETQPTVERFVTNAVLGEQIVQLPDQGERAQPALRVTVQEGATARSEWLLFGRPVRVQVAGTPIQLMLGWDTLRLPFTVTLEEFVVERDEGGEHVAGWTSKVRFTDPVSGEEKRAAIWMNHPAVFRGYKFSQASWDPQDLRYSVLQVKKDPFWVVALTWVGSGLTIVGIALTFYGRRWLGGK